MANAVDSSFLDVILKKYNSERLLNAQRKLCHAPFQNLYFGRDGKVTACCYNREFILGEYPQQSLIEIWGSESVQKMRAQMTDTSMSIGCEACASQLEAGNIGGLQAKQFDKYADSPVDMIYQKLAQLTKNDEKRTSALKSLSNEWQYIKRRLRDMIIGNSTGLATRKIIINEIKKYFIFSKPPKKNAGIALPTDFPRCIEFELSNTCNLECTMCFGDFSSSIRKNRENRPPLPMYYDDNFVQQLELFIPHLWESKFFGGEPFLVPIYYDIWEKMIQINPSVTIYITTNCTILNERVKRVLEKLNVGLIISIDSFQKETYEAIRQNANYERVMENLKYFEAISKKRGQIMSIAVCPMIPNWREIPGMVAICNRKGHHIYFNTVWFPLEASLRSLSSASLSEIITFYEYYQFEEDNVIARYNIGKFKSMINQLKKWQEIVAQKESKLQTFAHWNFESDSLHLTLLDIQNQIDGRQELIYTNELKKMMENMGSTQHFINKYFEHIYKSISYYMVVSEVQNSSEIKIKVEAVRKKIINEMSESEIIEKIFCNNHKETVLFIAHKPLEEMNETSIFFSLPKEYVVI